MPTGKIIWFDESRGYGFLNPDDGIENLFVHKNELNCHSNLQADEEVFFETGSHNNRPCAVNVQLINEK